MHAWKDFVDQYQPAASFEDDIASTRVCQLAATAAELGTNAVGAVLLDDQGTVLAEGHNETFLNGFRSDLHAEMVVLTKFESEQKHADMPESDR